MKRVTPFGETMWPTIVFDKLKARIELFGVTERTRVLMIQDSGRDFGKLPAIELSWPPVALDKSLLCRNKLIDKLAAEQIVQRR